jgi:SAM-dependent methyltransferase
VIFSLGIQPLANKYPSNAEEKSNEFKEEMKVYFCNSCGYVNIPCSVNRSIFFQDYYYLSSVNTELSKHFQKFAEYILKNNYEFVVDIGSNDGILLRPLQKHGVKCLGIDPSENVSKIANDQGLTTVVGFFDDKIANNVVQQYGFADLVTASSVFTHLEDPLSFFSNVKKILHPNGKLIIEVEYLEKIISDFAFERFYFDRPHYYSLRSLAKMGAIHGFNVEDVELIDVHGGSIRVTFSISNSRQNESKIIKILEHESISLTENQLIVKFNEFDSACVEMRKTLESFKSMGMKVAGYGCPARFSTITNFAKFNENNILFVVDDSHLKQNRFSPGSHIPIVKYSPETNIDIYIVFAFEYIQSIKNKIGLSTCKFYKPVPFMEI